VGDVLSEFLDGDAGLYPAYVGLAEHELIEGNVARRAERDLAGGGCHVNGLRDGRSRASPSTSNPSRTARACLSLSLHSPHRSAITDVEYLGAGRTIGAHHFDERRIRESVVGLRARFLPHRDYRAAHRGANDVLEYHHAAVDDGQPGSDAVRLDPLAVVAAKPRTTGVVKSKPSRPIERRPPSMRGALAMYSS
jgi:hypothetical protein